MAKVLKEKLGCVIWQLPGNFKINTEPLWKFCQILSFEFHNVFEPRYPSWLNNEVFDIPCIAKMSFCIVFGAFAGFNGLSKTTSPVYLRFHWTAAWYNNGYDIAELSRYKNSIIGLKPGTMHAYFNNKVEAQAVYNAAQFRDLF